MERTFENILADYIFFSVKARSYEGIVSHCTGEEVEVRNAMLKNARKKVPLCDSSKFGHLAAFQQCQLDELDYLVTDYDAVPDVISSWKAKINIL